ncbi:hypothetical protein AAMO2058_001736400 [Amorphochlora amoebiformis]
MGVVGLIEWAVGVGAWAGWWDEGECDKKQSTEIDMPGSRMPLASIPDTCLYRVFSMLGMDLVGISALLTLVFLLDPPVKKVLGTFEGVRNGYVSFGGGIDAGMFSGRQGLESGW